MKSTVESDGAGPTGHGKGGNPERHDTKRPTELLNSVALFERRDSKHWSAPLFNVKLPPGSLKSDEGTRKLVLTPAPIATRGSGTSSST